MTSFCLLHGAWHDGAYWSAVADDLRARGHMVADPDLPLHDPAATFARRVAPALDARATLDDPLVVVGHSMGAAYAPTLAATRPGSLLVHLCGGFGPLRETFPWPSTGPDGVCVWDPDTAVSALYSRLDPTAAQALAAPAADGAEPGPRAARAGVRPARRGHRGGERRALRSGGRRGALRSGPADAARWHFPMAEDPAGLAARLDGLATAPV